MKKINYIIIVAVVMGSFFSCKKDKKEPDPTPATPVEEPDFTLQASDVNYPIGTTWVYSVSNQTTTTALNVQVPPNIENSTSTYTLKVIYDSILVGNVTGKVLQYNFGSNAIALKELQYVNSSTNIWNQILFGSINNTSVTPSALAIQLPLSSSSKWKNPYYPNQSTIDSCNSIGYENLQLNIGYLKCIKFKAHNINNSYWYNKSKGCAMLQSAKYSLPNINTMMAETSTITLTKFN